MDDNINDIIDNFTSKSKYKIYQLDVKTIRKFNIYYISPVVNDDLFATKPKGAISSKVFSIGIMTGITCEVLTFIHRKNHFIIIIKFTYFDDSDKNSNNLLSYINSDDFIIRNNHSFDELLLCNLKNSFKILSNDNITISTVIVDKNENVVKKYGI